MKLDWRIKVAIGGALLAAVGIGWLPLDVQGSRDVAAADLTLERPYDGRPFELDRSMMQAPAYSNASWQALFLGAHSR